MERVTIDSVSPDVKVFIQSLPLRTGAVQLELDGRIIYSAVASGSELTEAEKTSFLQRGRQLVEQARQCNAGVSEAAIETEVALAVEEVRRRGVK